MRRFLLAAFVAALTIPQARADTYVTLRDIGGNFILEVAYDDGAVLPVYVDVTGEGSQRTILVGPNGEALPVAAARRILARYGDLLGPMDAVQAERLLIDKAEEYADLAARLAEVRGDSPVVDALRAEAAALLAAGDFRAAEQKLADAVAEYRRIQEEAEIDALHVATAQTLADQAQAVRLDLRYLAAAALYREASDETWSADHPQALEHRNQEAQVTYHQGDEFGDNAALETAIGRYETLARLFDESGDRNGWAGTQNNLGIALSVLGERESGTARLEKAAAAYRAALEEYTRERVPLDWATTHNNLGNALWTLGERESGTARLEEAVAAFRAALEERTRERAPLHWAMTQNNLGSALSVLGERESGTARLEQAVAAFRAALEEYTRERVPLDWAITQNNLGAALYELGEREGGTARLEEAVAAFRAALEERTRERVPLQWAKTQNNLGAALRALGARESGTARLEEAVAASRAALEEYTRERVPLDWARTQNNLGAALLALGARESGTARLEEAVAAFRAALEEYTRERVPLQWAATTMNMAGAQATLGHRRQNVAALRAAIANFENLAAFFDAAGAPRYANVTRRNARWARGLLRAVTADPRP